MKLYTIIILAILSVITMNAQEITVYGQRNTWNAGALCDLEFACDYRLYIGGGQVLIGYAYHPNGDLWLIATNTGGAFRNVYIYTVALEGCTYTLSHEIPLPEYWQLSSAANIDHYGRLYLVVHQWDSIESKRNKTLSRLADPNIPVFETLLTFNSNLETSFWEVHFENDKVYLVATKRPHIWVYSSNFQILDTIITQKHIWGLTAISYGCDSVITYASHMGYSTEDYLDTGLPDTMMYISKFDLQTNSLIPECQYWMGDAVSNTNLTSPLEFLSSDPECDLLIDLDRDNSTGVYPYDYLDSTTYCTTVESPICDADVFIHTSAPLDSIVLTMSGVHESADEVLMMTGFPAGITFIQRNDSTYVLVSSNPIDSIYQKALLSIRYQHSGAKRTPGVRRVILQGFNSIKDGVKISATLHISGLPFAGDNATLLICNDTLIQDMAALTGGQSGGYWSPSLTTGGNVFDSEVDLAPDYQYIVIDPVCGNDTAVVTINRDSSAPVDLLGDDMVLCVGDTTEITITQNAINILWDNGDTDITRAFSQSGMYWVVLETSGGCSYSDSLIITEGVRWDPEVQIKDPVCDLPNGEITIDPIEFAQNGSAFINGIAMNAPAQGSLTQGIYEIMTVSNDVCEYKTEVTLSEQPMLDVSIDTQAVVLEGIWEKVEYTELNSVPLIDVIFDPTTSIRWTGDAIEVQGNEDQQYEITFVDENGCTNVHLLHVLVEKANGIYLPNIFNPKSTSGNDLWSPSISETYQLEVLRIYDRWGGMVHQSTLDATWEGTSNGQECSPGVFVYQLIITHRGSNERKVMMGDITLIR